MVENTTTVRAFITTLQAESPSAAAAKFGTPDFRWWVLGHGDIQDQLAGLDLLMARAFKAGGFSMTVDAMTAEGDRVAVEATSRGLLPDGTVYRNQYHWLFVLRDGQIALAKEYNDPSHVREVLGPLIAEIQTEMF